MSFNTSKRKNWMPKRKSGLLKKAFQTSKQKATCTIIKSILLPVVCFCIFTTDCVAQKVNIDQQVLIELMEHRHDGATNVYQKISNTTQTMGILVPITVLATG